MTCLRSVCAVSSPCKGHGTFSHVSQQHTVAPLATQVVKGSLGQIQGTIPTHHEWGFDLLLSCPLSSVQGAGKTAAHS